MDHGLPISSLFEMRQTTQGRSLFASQDIPKDTPLLETGFVPIWTIQREYRREVCASCFSYERGRNLKVRDQTLNFSFCNAECMEAWNSATSLIEAETWTAIEAFVKKTKSRNGGTNKMSESEDSDGDVEMGDQQQKRPTESDIDKLWDSVESTAHFIRQARMGSTAKPHRRALEAALNMAPDADTLYFLSCAVLTHYQRADSSSPESSSVVASSEDISHGWAALLSLQRNPTPYQSEFHIRQHTYSYLQLLALLPTVLLPSVTPSTCRDVVAHDDHNAFGILSLDDSGSEFFGWGVWPTASYFNHSCTPNVSKVRDGRKWRFWMERDVPAGEELFISYMGGDEKDLSAPERQKRTGDTWGFVCQCSGCRMGLGVVRTSGIEDV
jgi:hypothetical protein